MQQGWFIGKAKCEASWHKHREGPQQPLLSFAGSPEALGKVLLKFPALVSVDVRGDLGFSGCLKLCVLTKSCQLVQHRLLPALPGIFHLRARILTPLGVQGSWEQLVEDGVEMPCSRGADPFPFCCGTLGLMHSGYALWGHAEHPPCPHTEPLARSSAPISGMGGGSSSVPSLRGGLDKPLVAPW